MTDQNEKQFNLIVPEDVAMVDVEASSLKGTTGKSFHDLLSYPIEIGVAHSDGHSEAKLIKPEDEWTDWNGEPGNPDVGLIHGISRTELFEKGEDVRDVAHWLNREIGEKTVMCDSPEAVADIFWLNRLFEAAGVERQFEVRYLYDYVDLNDPVTDEAYENAGIDRESEHRAGEDAADIMVLYCEYYALKIAEYHANLGHDGSQGFDL